MDEPTVVREPIAIPQSELQWRFSRSSGPGGHGVNTTDSRVQRPSTSRSQPASPPRWVSGPSSGSLPSLADGRAVISALEHRSQWQNRKAAERRFADTLGAARGGVLLSEQHTRQLDGKLRELRFHVARQAIRITYRTAPGRLTILLPAFAKTKNGDRAQVARAKKAMLACMRAEHRLDEVE